MRHFAHLFDKYLGTASIICVHYKIATVNYGYYLLIDHLF